MDAGRHRRRADGRVPQRDAAAAAVCRPCMPTGGRRAAPLAANRIAGRLPRLAAGDADQRHRAVARRAGDSRPAVQDGDRRGEAAGGHLRPRRSAAADAARLALHVLLLELVRRESVPRQPRLHRALGELPARDRLRLRVPPARGRGRARRRPNTRTCWPAGTTCRGAPTWTRRASGSGAGRTAATSARSRSAGTPTCSRRAWTGTACTRACGRSTSTCSPRASSATASPRPT